LGLGFHGLEVGWLIPAFSQNAVNHHTFALLEIENSNGRPVQTVVLNPSRFRFFGLHSCLPENRATRVFGAKLEAAIMHSQAMQRGNFRIGVPGPRLCARCKSAPARQDQWYCRQCSNLAMRAYRARDRRELARLQQVREHLSGINTFTRRRFEERCGWDRRVLVISKEGVPLTSGLVIGFLPGEDLLVRDEAGKELRVRLEEAVADAGFRYESPAETVASDPEIQSSSAAPETIGTAGHQRRYWLLPARSYADGHFETPGGQDEIRRMRLGWNELSVIKVCHAYVPTRFRA
jgi:hypothetical protein